MRGLSWTVLALLAVSWMCVQSRSIDTPTNAQKQEAEVDKIAAGLTVEIIDAALKAAVNTEMQKTSNTPAQRLLAAEIVKEVEEEVVKEVVEEVAKEAVEEAAKEVVVELTKEVETSSKNAISPILDFETGTGDNENELSGTRDKRTIANIGRLATCLFTILVNPSCFQQMRSTGGGGGGGLFGGLLGGGGASSRSNARQEAYNRQLRQWMQYQKNQIAKLNATEGGNYTTPFPILPPAPPAEEDSTTARPNFIAQVIQFKLNLIPNLFRTARSLVQSFLPFLQNLGGGGGGSGGGLLGSLGGLFRGRNPSSSSSFGGSSGSGSYGSGSSSSSGSSYGSSSSSNSGSGLSSAVGGTETSTYRISLGR